jgi:hypothetical protein
MKTSRVGGLARRRGGWSREDDRQQHKHNRQETPKYRSPACLAKHHQIECRGLELAT